MRRATANEKKIERELLKQAFGDFGAIYRFPSSPVLS